MNSTILKRISTFIMSMLLSIAASAQLTTEPFSYNTDISPSVESWKMTQHGSLKPSLSTGTMTYSLPLYTYSDEDFTIPISLEYSYGGYKPAVHSGIIGLGWTLNCGGVITREVRGYPDDIKDWENGIYGYWHTVAEGVLDDDRYKIASGKIRALDRTFVSDVDPLELDLFSDDPAYELYGGSIQDPTSRYDTNPDLFHFSFLGFSGEFMMGADGEIHVFNSSFPRGECSITIDRDKRDTLWTPEIVISTGDGYEYTFGGTEKSIEYNVTPQGDDGHSITVTAWRLRRMSAPNGNSVEFIYDGRFQREHSTLRSYTNVFQGKGISNTGEAVGYNASSMKVRGSTSYYPLLSAISVNGNITARFSYEKNAVDENSEQFFICQGCCYDGTLPQFKYSPTRNLTAIHITNKSRRTIEKIILSKKSSGGNNGTRLLLDSVAGLSFGRYSFKYADRRDLPENDTEQVDYWGYWNTSGTAMKNLFKHIDYANASETGDLYKQFSSQKDCRLPDFGRTLSCALTEITYPTGGGTTVEYEMHDASLLINRYYASPVQLTKNTFDFVPGGIRVKSIASFSGQDTMKVSYLYRNDDGSSSGILMRMPRYAMAIGYHFYAKYAIYDVRAIGYTSECFQPPVTGDPEMVYRNVREDYPDGSHIVYKFSSWLDYPDLYATMKDDVTFYDKVYDDRPRVEDLSLPSPWMSMLPTMIDNRSLRGKLISQTEYSGDHIVRTITNYYTSKTEMTQLMLFNILSEFAGFDWQFISTYLSQSSDVRTDENGMPIGKYSYTTYNDWGQKDYERVYSSGSGDAQKMKYVHEDDDECPKHLRSALSVITRLKPFNDSLWVVSVERLEYDTNASNPNPVAMTYWSPEIPEATAENAYFVIPSGAVTRSARLRYDNKNRIVRADLPGGAYVTYVWDAERRHIIKKTVNGAINREEYSWIDMVGLKSRSMPTGQEETYEYDSHNRLSAIRDTEGRKTASFMYHLRHE